MTNATTRIPWARLFAEGAAIVISILLAFAIDAWWDGRLERGTERRLIANLQADFAKTLADLERVIAVNERSRDAARTLLANTGPGPADMPAARFDSLLALLYVDATFDPSNGTLLSLLSSEGLGAISSPDLRTLLSSWAQEAENAERVEEAKLQHWADQLAPYLTAAVPMRTTIDNLTPTEKIGASRFPFTPAAVLGDVRFESVVANRLLWTDITIFRLREAQKLVEEIVAALDGVAAS